MVWRNHFRNDPPLYNRYKPLLEETYHPYAFFSENTKYSHRRTIDIDVTKIEPQKETFQAKKRFWRKMRSKEKWLRIHGFSVHGDFMEDFPKVELYGWGEVSKKLDNEIIEVVKDFNKLSFAFTNGFSCSGMQKDHGGDPYQDFGFLRFKYKPDDTYYNFEEELAYLQGTEIRARIGEYNKELRLLPSDDKKLNKLWKKVHHIIKQYLPPT